MFSNLLLLDLREAVHQHKQALWVLSAILNTDLSLTSFALMYKPFLNLCLKQ